MLGRNTVYRTCHGNSTTVVVVFTVAALQASIYMTVIYVCIENPNSGAHLWATFYPFRHLPTIENLNYTLNILI